jgi:hypothetical protein
MPVSLPRFAATSVRSLAPLLIATPWLLLTSTSFADSGDCTPPDPNPDKTEVIPVADLCVSITKGEQTFLYPANKFILGKNYEMFLNSLTDVSSVFKGQVNVAKGPSGTEISAKSASIDSAAGFVSSFNGALSEKKIPVALALDSASAKTDFRVEIAASAKASTAAKRVVLAHLTNGGTHDFATSWMYGAEEQSLIVVTVQETTPSTEPCGVDPAPKKPTSPTTSCSYSFVLFRVPTDGPPKVLIGFREQYKDLDRVLEATPELRQTIDQYSEFTVNDVRIRGPQRSDSNLPAPIEKQPQPFIAPPGLDGWTVSYRQLGHACRAFPTGAESASITIPHIQKSLGPSRDNGIAVGAAKIYDVLALQRMLLDTANQLTTLVGFNGPTITAALSNFQGITRDTSYFSAQLATVPSASVVGTTSNGLQNALTNTTLTPQQASSNTTVTLQCPDGSVPTIGTGNTQGCGAAPSGVTGSSLTTTTGNTTNAAVTNTLVNGSTNTQQNGTTTTTPSLSGSSYVPTPITANSLAPPSSTGLSSADLLTEQVELNAQITTLRLLLQGALSDQYLVKDARPVATRQQTTLGFTISLQPPRQYKHAVAEVRVIISPPFGGENVSVMNLLPSEKTYNVAKVTSHENAFGAGVVKAPIGLGVAGGSSHDRLFLAKDTDTVALQFASLGAPPLDPRLPVAVRDWAHTAISFEGRGECDDDIASEMQSEPNKFDNAVAFGWQFRPVLGEEYVKSGLRQVFAQLALPAGLDMQYIPRVRILTRWRAYDPKSQVVGAVFSRTCSWTDDSNGVVLISRPAVHTVDWVDLGGGQLKLTGQGRFYSSGVTIVAGTNAYAPVGFDGTKIQFVAKAADLMGAEELALVGQNGQSGVFGNAVAPAAPGKFESNEGCGIPHASMSALPTPDGNSRMQLTLEVGERFAMASPAASAGDDDGPLHPLVMIGSQVYGLRETPFSDATQCSTTNPQVSQQGLVLFPQSTTCTYNFVAPTTDVRNAQMFLVRDVAWNTMKSRGPIHFLPSFSGLTAGPWATPKDKNGKVDPNAAVTYGVTGFNLRGLEQCHKPPAKPKAPLLEAPPEKMCLSVPSFVTFKVLSDNAGSLEISGSYSATKVVRLELKNDADLNDWDKRVVWDLPVPKADAAEGAIAAVQVHRGDSAKVTFKGNDLDKVDEVDFETIKGLAKKYDANSKSLAVFLTTAITKTPGHKELTATGAKLGGKTLQLPVDVLK